jgi:large conductance mechanosensitive channel
MTGFKKFLLRGNVVDLAVAFVLGVAFAALINSFVVAFVTPLVGVVTGAAGDFSSKTFTIADVTFRYGVFVNALLSFVIIAAVIYFFVVIPVNNMMERFKPGADEPTETKDCTECLSAIPRGARKCAFCSSVQKATA